MWYLKNNLSGEAERLIRHLQLSDTNYTTAWSILKGRYNNQRLLVSTLIDKLMSQSTISVESATAIKKLHDTSKECLLGLANLNVSTKTWDPILLHMLVKKIDRTTHGLYEQSLKEPRDCQSIDGFLQFLELRFQSLEALGNERRQPSQIKPQQIRNASLITSTTNAECKNCAGKHKIFTCDSFLNLKPSERFKQVKTLKLCINCLKDDHSVSHCKSRSCSKCQGRHNTLLHLDTAKPARIQPTENKNQSPTTACDTSLAAQGLQNSHDSYVLLGTAMILINTQQGSTEACRAILDSGSQLNFISERMCRKLKITGKNDNINISGIGSTKTQATRKVSINISSNNSGYSASLEAYIIPDISTMQLQMHLEISSWPIPKNLTLADPSFNKPRRVDLLIGAEFYCELMSIGQIKLDHNLPTIQNTVFGWMVVGRTTTKPKTNAFCGISNFGLDRQLEAFWTLEEVSATTTPKRELPIELQRSNSGTFEVKLPLCQNPSVLGNSEDLAVRRFLALERKLSKQPQLKQQYAAFIDEYIQLNHMEEVTREAVPKVNYFLPHHCVLKPTSTTTKLRVVFDASAKTSTNLSLNDIMMKGPTIQDKLFSILLRFRTHKFVFSADIEKMYRQISISHEDRNLQLIIWRSDPNLPLRYYRLRTVTYETTAVSYLPTKCLAELAESATTSHPHAAHAMSDFYVDDIMTGSNSLKEAFKTQRELKELVESAGFNLRKWCSNHEQLLSHVPKEDREAQVDIEANTEGTVKALGLTWHPRSDQFAITTSWTDQKAITKRTVSADIAHIFDPLGFLSPVVVSAKIFLQRLWSLKLDWDAAIPLELHTRWSRFREELNQLNTIRIARFLETKDAAISLHAFADASEQAYGAVIYVRSTSSSGEIKVTLLCSKSRVAPVRTTTLPRLELCAANLMAHLVARVKEDLKINIKETHNWTDSQIVLAWIQSTSSSYHTIVSNRISSIQELTNTSECRYINTKLNPADLVSRGIRPGELMTATTWFKGPAFLQKSETEWPCETIAQQSNLLEETAPRTVLLSSDTNDHFIHHIDHGNSFTRLKRIVAYVLRAVQKFRRKDTANRSSVLTVPELEDALTTIVKQMQGEEFRTEIKQLKNKRHVDRKSRLINLAPFLDQQSVIRVGGRLQEAQLSFDAKHPIILPSKHKITQLLLSHLHKTHLHAGPLALQAITRQQFWILRGKQLATTVHDCVRCTRFNPHTFNQMMSKLPASRVQPAIPFVNVGIDFCGPVYTHYKVRGKRPTKSYICVFCCFATKACHLEVVSDLSTVGFIAALKRFIARRGCCQNIYCDNATNFVGARNQLTELQQTIYDKEAQETITNASSMKGINFHFIPPRSPHFGGIWEAAVKSAKHLLQRTVAAASLTSFYC